MGNCMVKRANRSYPSSLKVSVPNLRYLSRSSKTLLSVVSQEITLIKLKGKLRVYHNSCISFLADQSILVAGGSDSTCSLTNKVFIINPSQNSITELPQMPAPLKYGNFLQFNNYIYHIGGISEAEDHSSSFPEEASPLMRLNLNTYSWEVYKDNSICDPGQLLQRNIIAEEVKERVSPYRGSGIKLKDLLTPASVVYNDRIYLIGGKVQSSEGVEVLDKVFSFSVGEEDIEIKEEIMKLPVRLFAASACQRRNLACVAGGFLMNSSENLDVFIIDLSLSTIRTMKVRLDRPLEIYCPVFMDDKGILCFSPPKLMYVREDKEKIYTFAMPSESNVSVKEIGFSQKIESLSTKPTTRLANLHLSFNPSESSELISKSSEILIDNLNISGFSRQKRHLI